MKQRRQWSGDLEELWYMANRRLRTWEWAAKQGIIPLDTNYRNFKESLKKVRENLDNESAKETLKSFLGEVDLHLKGRLPNYLAKVEKIKNGSVSGAVKKLLEDNKKNEHDPIILIYLANAFHKLALSEKKDIQVSDSLNRIKSDVEAMLFKYKDGNYAGALADLRTIIAQIELLGFTRNDSAVTLAAVLYDQEIPPNMFDTLLAKAHPQGLIGSDDPIFLYLLDLREGIKYASLVKEYFSKDNLAKSNIIEEGIDIAEIESLLTSSGQKSQRLTPEKIISEILPELENPIDKLMFIQDEIKMRIDSLSKDPEGLILLQNEMLKIIGDNQNDEGVKNWILRSPLAQGFVSKDGIDNSKADEFELRLIGKDSSGKELQDLTTELFISDVLTEFSDPVEKLTNIQQHVELSFDLLSNKTKDAVLLQNEMLKIISENPKNDDVKKWILATPSDKNSLLDWSSSRFSLDPLSKVQRELRSIYSDDNQMLLRLMFREAGGGDPFKTTSPVDAFLKILFDTNAQVNKMPLEDIATYMIAHPEHAEYFLKNRSGIMGGRNFREDFLAAPSTIERMMLKKDNRLHDVLITAGISTKEQIQRVKESQSSSVGVHDDLEEETWEMKGMSEAIELEEVNKDRPVEKEKSAQELGGKFSEPPIPEDVAKETRESRVEKSEESMGNEQPAQELGGILSEPSILEVAPKKPSKDSVAQSEESPKEKAAKLIKEIEGVMSENSNINSGRRREVGAQLSFFKSIINKPGQAEKLIPALEGVKKMLIDESANKLEEPDKNKSEKPEMDPKDIMGATAALESIERISEELGHDTNLDGHRIKEIKAQTDFLFNVIKDRQWREDDHAPLLKSIEKEVGEAKVSSSGLKK